MTWIADTFLQLYKAGVAMEACVLHLRMLLRFNLIVGPSNWDPVILRDNRQGPVLTPQVSIDFQMASFKRVYFSRKHPGQVEVELMQAELWAWIDRPVIARANQSQHKNSFGHPWARIGNCAGGRAHSLVFMQDFWVATICWTGVKYFLNLITD